MDYYHPLKKLKTTGSFGFNYGSHDKEQTTYATLGNGTITVGGDSNSDSIVGLNRDVNNSQEITKNLSVEPIEYEVDVVRTYNTLKNLSEATKNLIEDYLKKDEDNDGKIDNNRTSTHDDANKITFKDIANNELQGIGNGINMFKHIADAGSGIDAGLKDMGVKNGLADVPLSPVWVANKIENYTTHELTWEKGGSSVYKYKDENGSVYSSLNPDANNIGRANETENENLKGTIIQDSGFFSEGGKMSSLVNELKGMNAMSIMHDKWTDTGVLSQHGFLETSIIPAIPITYWGLVGKDIQNNTK